MAENLGLTFRSLPLLALAIAGPIALAFLIARERHRIRLAKRFISESMRGVANPARALRPYLAALAVLAAAVALAGPRAGYKVMPVEERSSNRVIAIDVSESMGARDVGASRLDAAKAIAKRIVEADTGRVALVVFESRAEVACPLTSDDEGVAELIDSIQPGEVGDPGTDLGSAILKASLLVDLDPAQKGDIIVISDGEDQGSRADEAVRRMRQRGISVTSILVGTTNGSTIPRADGRELRDDSGQVVDTYAHPEILERVARATGGRFYENPFGEHDLDSLAAAPGMNGGKRDVKVPIERFQWPLALGVLALMLGSFANRGAE
jgi:Ca-activated chloride channel homolog